MIVQKKNAKAPIRWRIAEFAHESQNLHPQAHVADLFGLVEGFDHLSLDVTGHGQGVVGEGNRDHKPATAEVFELSAILLRKHRFAHLPAIRNVPGEHSGGIHLSEELFVVSFHLVGGLPDVSAVQLYLTVEKNLIVFLGIHKEIAFSCVTAIWFVTRSRRSLNSEHQTLFDVNATRVKVMIRLRSRHPALGQPLGTQFIQQWGKPGVSMIDRVLLEGGASTYIQSALMDQLGSDGLLRAQQLTERLLSVDGVEAAQRFLSREFGHTPLQVDHHLFETHDSSLALLQQLL
mmetsp:Transcript_49822/g.125254  ORF Transcript_49822/g.125254 Transcript_49822/m.125254 type:complete len:290 (+) Transcript_49822:2016-2885(+)